MARLVRCFAALALAVVLLGGNAHTASLTHAEKAKLHPSLQRLMTLRAQTFTGAPWLELPAAGAEEVGVLVYTNDPGELRAAGIKVQSVLAGVATARVRTEDLETLARLDGVRWVDPGAVSYLQNDVSVPETGAPLLHAGFLNATKYRGKGAIVLVYDTGIDWKHMDFRDPADPTKTRILAIWDQTITPGFGESPPAGFTYGVEYEKIAIENEINGMTAGAVREADLNGHGTHVAGIAAGNGLALGKYAGMAPEADLVVVKGGNGSFPEPNMIDGIAYANSISQRFNKPVVVNWSIGGHSGPHDGTRSDEVAIDRFVTTPGHVVCASAGNEGDLFVHRGGVLAANASDTIVVYVPYYMPYAGAGNDRFIVDGYLRSSDSLTMEVISPRGIHAIGPGTCPDTSDGTIDMANYISPLNGKRGFQLQVSDKGGGSVPMRGFWGLIITNPSSTPEEWDVWLLPNCTVGGEFSELDQGDNGKTVGMPGSAHGAITVGSYVTRWSWPSILGQYTYDPENDRTGDISLFSAIGPTADGRPKPDIAAPGQGIVSCLSSMSDTTGEQQKVVSGEKHRVLEGTSMATPHVTGACALLLGANSSLTAAQIKTYLQNAATADAMTSSVPNMVWGAGKLDVLKAMASLLSVSTPVTRTLLSYDNAGASTARTLAGSDKLAVRFSPVSTGQLTGLTLNVTTAINNPIVGTGDLVCEFFTNGGGTPGTKIGNSVTVPLSSLCVGTLNYVQTVTAGVNVVPGANYFAVLSLSGSGDTLKIRSDRASDGSRSMLYNGSWSQVMYNYRIRAVVTGSTPTVIASGETTQPLRFGLAQNYPNPFNPTTKISYTIPSTAAVRLVVFDLLGREVKTLVAGEQKAGTYLADWDGTNLRGIPVASGVYFYKLEAGETTLVRKMMLLR